MFVICLPGPETEQRFVSSTFFIVYSFQTSFPRFRESFFISLYLVLYYFLLISLFTWPETEQTARLSGVLF
jgi:hypothetical protein